MGKCFANNSIKFSDRYVKVDKIAFSCLAFLYILPSDFRILINRLGKKNRLLVFI